MHDQLANFGVTTRQDDDGIEVDGLDISNLRQPKDGVHCYDDHRVAMSFSILALASPHPTLISERECVGKTWPGWWDELRQNFGIEFSGVDLDAQTQASKGPAIDVTRSLFLIGMRGAGKSTAGDWAASILEWPLMDLDAQLESELGCTIQQLISRVGWEGFRNEEVVMLLKVMVEKPTKHVFACGGGIVESAGARKLLTDYHRSGGLVLFIHRNIEAILAYLKEDQTRPGYTEEIRQVWERRRPWYEECSNYEYFSGKEPSKSLLAAPKDFSRFLMNMTGREQSLEQIKAKGRSFFVSLTVKDVYDITDVLPEVIAGTDAVELRVDLLADPNNGLPSIEYVGQQLSLMRGIVDVPVIFTIRSKCQGGQFPDHEADHAMALYRLALKMGIEFLDLEVRYPDTFLQSITEVKRQTKIIASHHDLASNLHWEDGSWIPFYSKALRYGDIVKLIGVATVEEDNLNVYKFRKEMEMARPTLSLR